VQSIFFKKVLRVLVSFAFVLWRFSSKRVT